MRIKKIVLTKPKQNVSFTYPTVPDDQQFDKMVVILLFWHTF